MRSLLILLFLLSLSSFGQSVEITISNLIHDNNGNEISWRTCNTNNLFYTADTIVFNNIYSECNEEITIKIIGEEQIKFSECSGYSDADRGCNLFLKTPKGNIKKIGSTYYLYLTLIQQSRKKIKMKFKILELIKHTKKGSNADTYTGYLMKLVKS